MQQVIVPFLFVILGGGACDRIRAVFSGMF